MQFALNISSVCAYVEAVACAQQALMWPGEDTCLRLICDAMELKTQKQTSGGWTLRLRPDAGKRSTSLRDDSGTWETNRKLRNVMHAPSPACDAPCSIVQCGARSVESLSCVIRDGRKREPSPYAVQQVFDDDVLLDGNRNEEAGLNQVVFVLWWALRHQKVRSSPMAA